MFKAFPHIQQTEQRDCGPVCLQMILQHYGKYYDIEYIRELTGADKEGVSVYDLIKAAEALNLRAACYKLSFYKFRERVILPCIAHWKGNHFVVVYKITKKHIYVSDPAYGRIKYNYYEFAKNWLTQKFGKSRHGICLILERTPIFQNTINTKSPTSSYIEMMSCIAGYVKPYKRQVIQLMLMLIVLALINALPPIMTQSIIDIGIPNRDFSFITIILISLITLNLSCSVSSWVQQSINLHMSARIKLNMISDYFSRLMEMPLAYFESKIMGDILQRTSDFDRLETTIKQDCFNALLGIMHIIVFGIILCIYSPLILGIYLLFTLLYISWILFFWSVRKKLDIKVYSYIANNQSIWIEFLSKITDIKLYNYGYSKKCQWEKNQIRLFKSRIKLLHTDQIQNIGVNVISSIKDALLIYFSAIAVTNGQMTIGMLIAVQYIIGQLSLPIDNIVSFIVSVQLGNISFKRVVDVYKIAPESNSINEDQKPIHTEGNIKFNKVYFRYNQNDSFVLQNISFLIELNKITAIVGESGSGKTSIIKLLSRLYTPTSGSITIGNTNFTTQPVSSWRALCGVVTQDSCLLKDSVYNNIVFGRKYDEGKLLKAVNEANIKDEIERMPQAFNTMIGENGIGVSEGQKQRILLARALYDDPMYIFLDETTNALDSKNENSILKSVLNNCNGKTIVIASHRLSTIKVADKIIVLKNGIVVETGSHKQLIEAEQEYYNLFKSQI